MLATAGSPIGDGPPSPGGGGGGSRGKLLNPKFDASRPAPRSTSPRLVVLAAASAPFPRWPPSCPGCKQACIPAPLVPQRWLVGAVQVPPKRRNAATPASGGIPRPSPPGPSVAVRAAPACATPTNRARPPSAVAGPTTRPYPLVLCLAGGRFPPLLPGPALVRLLACVPGGPATVLLNTRGTTLGRAGAPASGPPKAPPSPTRCEWVPTGHGPRPALAAPRPGS